MLVNEFDETLDSFRERVDRHNTTFRTFIDELTTTIETIKHHQHVDCPVKDCRDKLTQMIRAENKGFHETKKSIDGLFDDSTNRLMHYRVRFIENIDALIKKRLKELEKFRDQLFFYKDRVVQKMDERVNEIEREHMDEKRRLISKIHDNQTHKLKALRNNVLE
jgi:hypothetical protein